MVYFALNLEVYLWDASQRKHQPCRQFTVSCVPNQHSKHTKKNAFPRSLIQGQLPFGSFRVPSILIEPTWEILFKVYRYIPKTQNPSHNPWSINRAFLTFVEAGCLPPQNCTAHFRSVKDPPTTSLLIRYPECV